MSRAVSGEALVSETQSGLLRLARSRGLDSESSRDVVQQAYLSLYLKASAELSALEGWLYTVVRRRSLDWLRQARYEAAKRLAAAQQPAAAGPVSLDDRIDLERALAKLSPKVRQFVRYRFFEGYSETEAAVLAGYSASSGKKTLTRALATLRLALEPR